MLISPVATTAGFTQEKQEALLPVYAQMPVRPVSGRGSWLIDEEGNRWLDAYGGHAVASTGHSHPRVVQAIAEQAGRLLFYSTAVPLPVRDQLANRLASLCPAPLEKVFFCNSGAEANENALHLARRHTGRTTIVTLTGGWHGRTVATLACCDGRKYEEGARRAGMPLSRRAAFGDIASLDAALDGDVAALLLEPVQGMAGARECSREFLERARMLCTDRGIVLIFDEIQCGAGRSGAFTAAEAFGVTPDIITMAKGLASGLPIGAVVACSALTTSLATGDLGSTFGGGPVPCAAALATLDVIDDENLLANVRQVEEFVRSQCRRLGINVQGKGLLLGLRLPIAALTVQRALFEQRILTGTSTDPNVLRLLPPLTFSIAEADILLRAMSEVLF
ncbi:MAG: aminotransferase class III-fold pyridoxal phosphate-dependent enzyme [Gemmatimonadota bacterium]